MKSLATLAVLAILAPLAPGEARVMPVLFVIDPAMPAEVDTVTLSYTFFELKGAAAAPAGRGNAG